MTNEELIASRTFNGVKIDLVKIDTYGHSQVFDYRLDASSDEFSYQVTGLDERRSHALMNLLPSPTPEIHGARLSAYELEDETSKAAPGFYFFADEAEGTLYTKNAVYKLENLTTGINEEELYRPMFRAVAIEDPHWDEKVTKVLGRIQTVYAYDAASATYLAEITPSYALHFRKNVCERSFTNLTEEEEINKVFTEAGFEYESDFENEDGGESVIYMHCRSIDKRQSTAIDADIDFQFEYMFEEDDVERQKKFEDLCSNLEGNGWFSDVANFTDRRTDEQLEAAAVPLDYDPETQLRMPGM